MTRDLQANILRYLGGQQEPLQANLVSTGDLAAALRASERDVESAVRSLRSESLVDVVVIDRLASYVFITQTGRDWLRGHPGSLGA